MLRKSKFRFLSGKKLICLILVGWIASISAQGITNTLGGNTADDKFIVENSDSQESLVVTGEGNVGIGTVYPSYPLVVQGHPVGQVGIYFNGEDADWASIYVNAQSASANPGFGYLRSGFIRAHTYCNSSYGWVVSTGESPDARLVVNATGNVGIGFMSPDEKLEINGNMNLNGEINRKSTTGTANLVPVAYGTINSNGDILSGTGNFTCTWTGNHYEIIINGEDYYWTNYTTLVTTIAGGDKIASTNSGGQGENKLNIWFLDVSSSTDEQRIFQFVTYKS